MNVKLIIGSLLLAQTLLAQNIKVDRFEGKIKEFEQEFATGTLPKDAVVLLGSSSFANWGKKANEMLAPYPVINRGFGGSTAAEAIYYFDRVVLPLKPKVIFYYEGENDLAAGFSVDSTFANYLKMVKLVKNKLPGTKFVALSVKHSPSRKHIRAKQILYNGMVRGITKTDQDLGFVDIVPLQFRPDGTIDPDMFTSDSLHVSDAAYMKWATRMKQYLETVFPKPSTQEKWVTIFNGKDFDGWEQKGGAAKYEVKNGVVVGTAVLNTPNSFMCTKKIYKDFILEFEVLADTNLNSGVQFRSNSRPEYKEGVVHGYQCEIDPSERRFSGGIYDEQRRGWLYKPEGDPYAQMAFDRKGWNKYRIEAIGTTLKTYINGKLVTDIIDTLEASGFIGLQVHSIWKGDFEAGKQIMWRNIRICEK
ncbi:MAG: family 16 glycoside hydrolase [Bacteroidota bacterium]|nr:family 16 glycoside hydrolase [Bacteroidota bacterium]